MSSTSILGFESWIWVLQVDCSKMLLHDKCLHYNHKAILIHKISNPVCSSGRFIIIIRMIIIINDINAQPSICAAAATTTTQRQN